MYDALEALEWPRIFQKLLGFCFSTYGKKAWEETPFLETQEEIECHLQQVDALQQLIQRYGNPPIDGEIQDISLLLFRLSKGGSLVLSDLRLLLQVLGGAEALVGHVEKNKGKDPTWETLNDLFQLQIESKSDNDEVVEEEENPGEELGVVDPEEIEMSWISISAQLPRDILQGLERYVDIQGNLLDSASPDLQRLRRRVVSQRKGLQERMQNYIAHPVYSQALQAPVVSERDGRSVLPIKVEYKSTIPGVVHAGSASGATLFVEPEGVVELNNQIQKTSVALQREIERILQEISLYLQGFAQPLLYFLKGLGHLDKRLTAANLGLLLRGTVPKIQGLPLMLDLKQARHPLLIFQNPSSDGWKAIVPNDISLGEIHREIDAKEGVRTLLITGPNTGGKTVLLKTVGLFAVMLRAGLTLPVKEGSALSLFESVWVDIGDQQSIEHNLSTFSAHIEKLKKFVDPDTDLSKGLVLIDEIGAGTDPAEGAALAKAVLETLYNKGALSIVTTHLGELKLEAHQHPGYVNASVAFDPESLKPTYQLFIGTPGTSHAITIAQRLGLNSSVIQKARAALSQPVRESASLIEELEYKNRKASESLHLAESFKLAQEEAYEKLMLERQQFHEEKRNQLHLFKQSIKSRLMPLEAELKELKEHVRRGEDLGTSHGKMRGIGRSAEGIFEEVLGEIQDGEASTVLSLEDLSIQEDVRSRRLSLQGVVLEKLPNSQEIVFQAGNIRVTLPLADIEKISRGYPGGVKKKKKKPGISQLPQGGRAPNIPLAMDAKSECDVRGLRLDEAMEKVEIFLDQAALAGFETLGIIHGQGTGVLKKAIRQYLKTLNFIKAFHPAEATQGGDGKTIIIL
ncbi:MAG: Smr/MutS family protein [Cyanobacteria bacterium]|nr:Smr/MutS family protein [Cyanobacteriota bacterium]